MAPNHMMCIPRSILLDQDIKGSAYKTAICSALLADTNARVRMVVSREMALPPGFEVTGLRNVIMVA
jgi:hypothetical protein